MQFLYALHDALLKPMPGKSMAPAPAESWSMSPDGLVYEFVLRKDYPWLAPYEDLKLK
jgi:ABC-type transport system substrate-binding protein